LLSHRPQDLRVGCRRPAPRGASSDGPPAPCWLEQPLPCTSPASDVPRRRRGHHAAGSNCAGTVACPGARTSRCEHFGFDPRDQDRLADRPFRNETREGRNAFRRVTRAPGFTLARRAALVSCRECHAATHTVLTPRLTPAACVSTPCGAPLGQRRAADSPCGSSCGSDARCVGPTSAFSLLRTSTRASWVPKLFLPGESPGSRQVGFASADRTFGCRSSWEALSSSRDVCGRASDISVAIPTPGPASLARLVPCPRPTKTGPRSTA
jgi:hypothetical protein